MGKSNSRGRPGPGDRDSMGRMGPPQKIITRQSMGNDVKPLHQAEKPWVPSVKNKTEVDKDVSFFSFFFVKIIDETTLL